MKAERSPGKISRALRVVRRVGLKRRFVLLFCVCVVLTGVASAYFVRYLLKPNIGLVVNFPEAVYRDGAVVFAPRTPFSPAVAAGLKPHKDIIVSVNGTPISGSRDLVVADAQITRFDHVPVEVRRDGVVQTIHIRPSFNFARVDWIFVFVFSFALAFTAFALTFRQSQEFASNLVVLASTFYLVFTCVKPFYYESLLSVFLIHLGKLASWLLVFFALYFPHKKGTRFARGTLLVLVLGLYATFTVSRIAYYLQWAATGLEVWLERFRYLGRLANISEGVAYLAFFVLLIYAHVKAPYRHQKHQLEWILAGGLIALPTYFFLDQIPLILSGPTELRISMGSFSNLFLTFVPVFFMIGLTKRSVFNIKFFSTRYLVYALLVLFCFAFFSVLYTPLQEYFVTYHGLPNRIAGSW